MFVIRCNNKIIFFTFCIFFIKHKQDETKDILNNKNKKIYYNLEISNYNYIYIYIIYETIQVRYPNNTYT